MSSLPVIDVSPLRSGDEPDRRAVAARIGEACRAHGFFVVTGHGVDAGLQSDLERVSREFFALPEEEKAAIAMARGGSAWRGWFPVGGELTSGVPDRKEGVYFGAELPPGQDRPLHGPNLFPARPPELRETVLAYLDAMTALGHVLLRGIALSLDLPERYFEDRYTADPLVLFRVFHYPRGEGWGVGEHTDYGLLTILKQDGHGGLQVRTPTGWIDADPVPDSFVCNIGDMLDRLTGGLYRSTPHRVRSGPHDRLSWPFFFDPAWDADVTPVADAVLARAPRWDGADPGAFRGTYGDYLLGKVGRVFPGLREEVL